LESLEDVNAILRWEEDPNVNPLSTVAILNFRGEIYLEFLSRTSDSILHNLQIDPGTMFSLRDCFRKVFWCKVSSDYENVNLMMLHRMTPWAEGKHVRMTPRGPLADALPSPSNMTDSSGSSASEPAGRHIKVTGGVSSVPEPPSSHLRTAMNTKATLLGPTLELQCTESKGDQEITREWSSGSLKACLRYWPIFISAKTLQEVERKWMHLEFEQEIAYARRCHRYSTAFGPGFTYQYAGGHVQEKSGPLGRST
jgi:hypothetical protein